MELIKFFKLLEKYFPNTDNKQHSLSWNPDTEDVEINIWIDDYNTIFVLDRISELDDAEKILDDIIKLNSYDSYLDYKPKPTIE